MSEERDIPTLEDLAADIDAQIKRLDAPRTTAVTADEAMNEIRNTVLSLMKDMVLSTSMGLMFVQDLAEPVELTGSEADEIATLLKAFAASRPTDLALQGRLQEALELVSGEDDEDEDETEGDEN